MFLQNKSHFHTEFIISLKREFQTKLTPGRLDPVAANIYYDNYNYPPLSLLRRATPRYVVLISITITWRSPAGREEAYSSILDFS